MKKLSLQPNEENALTAFINDTIGRNEAVVRFYNILNSVDQSSVIALDSEWGSGKTFFVKQVKLLLDWKNPVTALDKDKREKLDTYFERNDKLNDLFVDGLPQTTVYYDAWENDNATDPILSLIYSMIKCRQDIPSVEKQWDLVQIFGKIADFFTGKNITDLVESLRGTDWMAEFKKQDSIHEMMQRLFDALIVEHGERLVIFIDELDRCKPTFAIQLLERIKHYFDDDRVTFVLSVNSYQLQHTICNYYGSEFDACRYLDKFYDWHISLPEADVDKYLHNIGYHNSSDDFDEMCKDIVKYFGFQLREIEKYMRLAKMAASKTIYNDSWVELPAGKALKFCEMCIIPILIGLKLYDNSEYYRFINGESDKLMINILSKTMKYPVEWLRETDNNGTDFIKTKINDRLAEVYQALFSKNFSNANTSVNVGKMSFSSQTRKKTLEIASMLSSAANLE